MRPELARAKSRARVRRAAGDWRRAGAIDGAAEAAIHARYPDDRVSRSPVWRALIFFFVWVTATSAAGIVFALFRPSERASGILLLGLAALLAGATEVQQGALRFDGAGGEAATSFLAVVSGIVGVAILLPRSSPAATLGVVLLVAGSLWAAAWRRWGFPVYALFGAASLFVGAGAFVPVVRLLWILAGTAAAFLATRPFADRSPHHAGWGIVGGVGLAAVYAAVNVYSLDRALIEDLRPGVSPPAPSFAGARAAAIALTALFPPALLAAGLRRRRRLLVDLGLLFAAISLVTLRAYVHLGPLWSVLAVSGAGCALLALAVERWLERGKARERGGLTADALFEDEKRAERAAGLATILVAAPSASPPPREDGWKPGGGSFGGGGASDSF